MVYISALGVEKICDGNNKVIGFSPNLKGVSEAVKCIFDSK